MTLILGKLHTTEQLIKYQKSMISKLEKKYDRLIVRIQSAEARIEETLGVQLCKVSDELGSYNIGLERLLIDKRRERIANK